MWELAIPAAFEHFTSAISREFISNKAGWAGEKSNEAVNFTNWHALEELEHQAVCYDVFKALGNRGWVVTSILLFCWIPATIIPIYSVQLYLLFKDKILLKPRNWIPYCRFIWKSFPMLARGALKYLSKSYRPWNTADQSLYRMHLKKMGPVLEKWKVLQENQKDNVSEK